MTSTVYDTLAGILDETFQVEPEMIRPDATLADMELDSLAVAELSAIVQEQFAVRITGEDVGKGSALRELAELIDNRIGALPASAGAARQ
ncbi:acyl carrier protein [Streptomyces sp. NPDC048424]|uniref:acyl carrier protein n=1 Tax=Streptomyces sp. NPDC048424 TaxID=3155265 RepID=UPI0034267B43